VGQLIGGGESGPEVMQVMQQIAASIGSYSATQAASAPCSAADILDGASKEFLVRVSSFSSTRFFFNPPYQSGSASGAAPAGLDFGGIDSLDDEELNGPMQVACCAAGIDWGARLMVWSICLQDLLNMMVSKAVLYDPVKELCGKFPAWMQSNAASTPPDDLERYKFCRDWYFCSISVASAALFVIALAFGRHAHSFVWFSFTLTIWFSCP
jgi:hypothetical protein